MRSARERGTGGDRPLDLWVVGHTNVDHFLHVAELPRRDRTVPVRSRESRLGGTAANIALAASAWGVRTGLVSRVGPDFPESYREALSAAGIDLRGLTVDPRRPSSACFIAEDGRGGQSTFIDQGPMSDGVRYDGPSTLFSTAPWTHLTTGAPEYLFDVQRLVRAQGGRLAVDPAQEIHYRWKGPELRRLLRGAEILFGNDHEIARAAQLLGARRAEALVETVPLVVRTEGTDGATAFHRDGSVHVDADAIAAPQHVTGAGDAFRGGFYAGWFEGVPLKGCLAAGVRSSSRWLRSGGQLRARGAHPDRRRQP